jgi:hypothetical protein
MPLPAKATRLEEARALELHVIGPPPEQPSPVVDGAVIGAPPPVQPEPVAVPVRTLVLLPLAARANGHVFDRDEPTTEVVEEFWADVETARRAIRREGTFWRRLRGDLSLATFRQERADGMALSPVPRTTSRSARHRSPQPSRGHFPTDRELTRSERNRAERHTRRRQPQRKGDA